MSDSAPMSREQTFHLEEYKALRKEIEFYIAEFRSQERSVVVAVGVIWGWLVTRGEGGLLPWSIPIILTVAAAYRAHVLNKHMRLLSGYIESIEDSFGVSGWEHHFTKQVYRVRKGDLANTLLTYALLVLSVLAFVFYSKFHTIISACLSRH